jgi:hypothetical protein
MKLARGGWLAVALSATVTCYPEFEFSPPKKGKTGSTATTGADGAGAAAGEGSMASSGGAAGDGAGAGAPTGGGPGSTGSAGSSACSIFSPNDCGAGKKCSIADESTGLTACVKAGNRTAWTKCGGDGDCAAALFCDHLTGVCKPVCMAAGDCPEPSGKAQCVDALTDGLKKIPGLKICTAHCHPETAAPCDDAFGPVTCYYDIPYVEFDCAQTPNLGNGASCKGIPLAACADGLGCVNDTCRKWCSPPTPLSSDCPWAGTCGALNPKVQYEGAEYGVCP